MNEPVKDLVLIEPTSINAATLFTSDTAALDLFLKDVETKAMDYNRDVSTAANRKKIASQAYKVTQSKVFLDNQGKALTKNINDSRKYLTDCLDKLKDRVRAPLTDWEAEYEKLKDFWAQPLDGMWPLRPVWCPDISKPVLYPYPFELFGAKQLTKCRRLTFEEFCQAATLPRFQAMRDAFDAAAMRRGVKI